jgi:hypothetical protein
MDGVLVYISIVKRMLFTHIAMQVLKSYLAGGIQSNRELSNKDVSGMQPAYFFLKRIFLPVPDD